MCRYLSDECDSLKIINKEKIMSELINNHRHRVDELKNILRKLQDIDSIESVTEEIKAAMASVPYEDVMVAEQELIAEGIPLEEMLKLCDIHSDALRGLTTPNTAVFYKSHPVSIFKLENLAIARVIEQVQMQIAALETVKATDVKNVILKLHSLFNELMDVEKHFVRKENLLFPFLEKYSITGPSTVMWGKHDQIRVMLKKANAALSESHDAEIKTVNKIVDEHLLPAVNGVKDMITKEENILLPLSIDTLTEIDWYEIYQQSAEIGFAIIEVKEAWVPEGMENTVSSDSNSGRITLPSGSFALNELLAIFSTLPLDLTFVDKDDTVRFFTEGPERIFQRSRAIIGRKVQFCHPPHSVAIVEQILEDFKSGKESKADFWINLHGQFIYINYYALRGEAGEYLGTLEASQNLTSLRKLEGEKRILSYENKEESKIMSDTLENNEQVKASKTLYMTYDAREDLAKGIHPADKVLGELAQLPENEEYLLITPFPPMPLIMKAKAAGFSSVEEKVSDSEFRTYFSK